MKKVSLMPESQSFEGATKAATWNDELVAFSASEAQLPCCWYSGLLL